MNFDGHLVGGSADATRLHFDGRAHVFNRALEDLQRLFVSFFAHLFQSVIKSLFRDRALSAPHDAVDELGHQRAVVNRIGKNGTSLCNSASRHRLLRASLRSLRAILRTALLAITDSD